MYEAKKKNLLALHQRAAKAGVDFENDGLISLYDEENLCFLIKSASVRGDSLTESDILVLDEKKNIIEGKAEEFDKRFDTHYEIYKAFPHIKSIVQLDMKWCGVWAQTLSEAIPPMSSLHAKHFFGEIPSTSPLDNDVHENLYAEMGRSVADLFVNRPVEHIKAAMICNFGSITFGKNGEEALETALILEEIVARTWQSRLMVKERYRYIPYVLTEELFS